MRNWCANGLTGGNAVISGFAGKKTIVTATGDTAKEFRDDTNKVSDETGVTARTLMFIYTLNAVGTVSLTIGKQGAVGVTTESAVTVTATIADTTDLTALRDAINNASGATGVTADFGR